MTGIERVKKAIDFQYPDRVPILHFNRDKERSDIFLIDVVRNFEGINRDRSEWGFVWERKDDTMGQPAEPVLRTLEELDSFIAPAVDVENRFGPVKEQMAAAKERGQYILASLQLTGFTIMSFLRGFEQIMEDFLLEPEKIGELADIVQGFETGLLPYIKELGFDGVAFYDDWGTQDGLLIAPALWRDLFKWRYAKQFSAAHDLGLDVYFHCCGQILPIIGDFIEIGVDMLNIAQPNLYDMAELGRAFGGKVCFVCPVSYQTTSLSGTRADIFNDVRALVENLGSNGGGLIGYLEEYESIGLSESNYKSCEDAFQELGKYCNDSNPFYDFYKS